MYKVSKEDKEVIEYLSKYKIMSVEDTKFIYNSNWYHRKRINRLIDEGYIKKYKFYYIELDRKGRKLIGITGKDYIKNKSNEAYMERLKQISNIATITINSDIEFIPSWKMKDKEIYTDAARKYQGKIIIKNKTYLVYYISYKKEKKYIHQLLCDINKVIDYENIIIFVDKLEKIENELNNLKFRKNHTYIIMNSKENKELIKKYSNIDFYEIVKKIYGERTQILMSDWKLSDYLLENNHYICNMLFIDTERLSAIKWFLEENENTNKIIDIITLKENEKIIRKVISNNIRILTIENKNLL